jgi:hypothetical protein
MASVMYCLVISMHLLSCVLSFQRQQTTTHLKIRINNSNKYQKSKALYAGVQEIIEDDDANRLEAIEVARIAAEADMQEDTGKRKKLSTRQPKEPMKKLSVREKTGNYIYLEYYL